MHLMNENKSMWWKFKRWMFGALVLVANRLFGKELTHRSRFVGWINQRWLAMVEIFSPARRRQSRFQRENPYAPWFVPAAITYIERELRPECIGFEWGCGRSTLWFAQRARHVTSVEGRRAWFEEVKSWLAKNDLADRVTLCLAEVTSEYDFAEAEIERYASVIDGIADGSLDFIVVDGHFREACLHHVGNKLRPGGMLIIDNSEVVPKALLDALQTGRTRKWNNGIWETTIIHRNTNNAPRVT